MRQIGGSAWIRRHRWAIVNAMLAPFGRACVKLGEWPRGDIVIAAIAALRDARGQISGEDGTPAEEVENIYFKLRGRHARLCVEDYADVTLWGPRTLVRQVQARLEELRRRP